ncbi:unnamed protein product [Microthlaspi erraticum]|uniref:Uncharacterized protein n=1 Tax=Microthlaspi erraticum TaxID=1685480 RepID=A0A6D2IS15_9BRAS|nr:unnamed protein product [Microthlaspi erraticum]
MKNRNIFTEIQHKPMDTLTNFGTEEEDISEKRSRASKIVIAAIVGAHEGARYDYERNKRVEVEILRVIRGGEKEDVAISKI